VEAALSATRLPLEVLDGVRDVGIAAVDPRLIERAIEDPPSRPDERLACAILLVARLLAHQHHVRATRTGAEDGLRPEAPQAAGAAARRGFAQARQRRPLGDQLGGLDFPSVPIRGERQP
jgi:hypothetical protein